MVRQSYEYARCVPVWLGVDGKNMAKECIAFARDTIRTCRELLQIYGNPAHIPKPIPNNPICQDMEKWEMLDALVSLTWLRRVWVKQEVGLEAQSTLMIGTESMDIKDLVEITLLRGDLSPSPYLRLYPLLDTFTETRGS